MNADQTVAELPSTKPPVEQSPDLARIIALPRRPRPTGARAAALVELMNRRYRNNRTGPCKCESFGRECITSLYMVQAWALYEMGLYGGVFGCIGVGWGKTILNILAPFALGAKLAVLLVPPNLVTQLIAEYKLLAQHFRVPSIVTHGTTYNTQIEGTPVLHVFPYSRLSRPEATTFLELLQADTVLSDEGTEFNET